MRKVTTLRPSFPTAPVDAPLEVAPGVRWQVLCGDEGCYRVGVYSPEVSCREDVVELERHDCPELFLLVSGRVSLLLADGEGGVRELGLEPGRPVLVTSPHGGFCPDGPFTGQALVVERDAFETEYREPVGWKGSLR